MRTELDISTKHCRVESENGILIVTLNRPEVKNAFSSSMLLAMYNAWRRLDADDSLYCAVLTAVGDTFCAGRDLKSESGGGGEGEEEFLALMKDVPDAHWQALLRNNRPGKPVLLAVEGYALAGGTEILQGTDIRVAADNATFGVTEVARGLYPMSGSTIRLRRQIPYAMAAEMLLTGRHVTAEEALRWGLINYTTAPGKALDKALEIAATISECGPLAVKAVTRSLREHQEALQEDEAMEASDAIGWPVLASKDAKEGMKAFAEKRKAQFTGE
jgi:enoyl-CoA hydratase